MNIGILVIENEEYTGLNSFNTLELTRLLSNRGFETGALLFAGNKCDIQKADEYMRSFAEAIIVCGNTELFYDYLSAGYELDKELKILEKDGIIYALMPEFSQSFISDEIIPSFNSKTKTFYNTVIFKTVGKTEQQLRTLLKDYIKNKNRISFRFISDPPECEVRIKFSSKTSKPVVDGIIVNVSALLSDITYSHDDVSLAYQIIDTLKVHNKKLCVAESFTGGGIISELIKIPGASLCVTEGITAYSNTSKINRLNVEKKIIESYGAVSIETVYEMAANILMQTDCDISLATTGFAGPAQGESDEDGLCFIAVGNKNGIHIYKYNFEGDRESVIKHGVKTALFQLYKKLNESEFSQLLKLQQHKEDDSAES